MKAHYVLIGAIILLLASGLFGYKHHLNSIEEFTLKEGKYISELEHINNERESLIKLRVRLQSENESLRDSVQQAQQKARKTRIVYVEARAATDSLPDSLNLAREVRAARELISDQEGHIKALLELQQSSDSLLHMRLREIRFYEKEVVAWQDRFDNLKAQKDEEIKQIRKEERKKGRRAFLKGLGVGAGAVVLLVIL